MAQQKRPADIEMGGIPKKVQCIFSTISKIKDDICNKFDTLTYADVYAHIAECARRTEYSINTCMELIMSDFADAPQPWLIAYPGVFKKEKDNTTSYYRVFSKVNVVPSYVIYVIVGKMMRNNLLHTSNDTIWIGEKKCPKIIRFKQTNQVLNIIYLKSIPTPEYDLARIKDLDNCIPDIPYINLHREDH